MRWGACRHRAAETAMRRVLAERRPDDSVLGEEFGSRHGSSGLTWILDPIDGTRAFLCGAPSWGVLIGLRDAGGIRYGLIDQPYLGERFEGGFGIARLTHRGGTSPLRARTRVALNHALLMTTFPEIGTGAEAALHVAHRRHRGVRGDRARAVRRAEARLVS